LSAGGGGFRVGAPAVVPVRAAADSGLGHRRSFPVRAAAWAVPVARLLLPCPVRSLYRGQAPFGESNDSLEDRPHLSVLITSFQERLVSGRRRRRKGLLGRPARFPFDGLEWGLGSSGCPSPVLRDGVRAARSRRGLRLSSRRGLGRPAAHVKSPRPAKLRILIAAVYDSPATLRSARSGSQGGRWIVPSATRPRRH